MDVVAYEGGRRRAFRRIPITPEGEAGEWGKAVRRSAAALRAAVEEMELQGSAARVLYRSPTQGVDAAGITVRWAGQAMEAAMLSCTDSLPYSALMAVCEAVVVGRDNGGEVRQTHVVTAAEREDICEALVQLVEEGGLRFVSATPIDAGLLAGELSRSLREKQSQRGRLYIGEHSSFFVVTGGGAVLFSRRIDLGLESMAQSLTRPIRAPGSEEPVELDEETARVMLHRHGIPDRETVVLEEIGLTGARVIPLLQPVLQRFIVELRQSLRFGVREEDRGGVTISVTGPGSCIPGLAKLIGEELELEATADEAYRGYDWSQPGDAGSELAEVLKSSGLLDRLNLQPRALARRRRTGRLRRWLWTGAAAAVVLIAFDGFRYEARLTEARGRAEALASRIADLEALQATSERLRVVLEAMGELEETVGEEVGRSCDYRACMQELSRITPESIRFTTVTFDRLSEQTMGSVRGYAECRGEGAARTDLETFISELGSSPLFEEVVLDHVTMGSVGGREGEQFEATFTAVSVARREQADGRYASVEGGVRP